jgi:hypothetical protein
MQGERVALMLEPVPGTQPKLHLPRQAAKIAPEARAFRK